MKFVKLYSDDIFISYGRADGRIYTDAIATELQKKGFFCYYDAYGSDAGRDPQPSLFKKLLSCSMLVVISSKYASGSKAVEQEIRRFIEAKGASAVILIDFDGVIEQAIWKNFVTGLRIEKEHAVRLTNGNPSADVLKRIETAFTYRKSKERLQLYTRIAAISLMMLIIAAIIAGWIAKKQLKRAEIASASADKQEKIALSLQLANESKTMFGDPNLIRESVEKAVEAVRISDSVGEYLSTVDEALRTSIDFLPVFINRFIYHQPNIPDSSLTDLQLSTAASYGGHYVAFGTTLYDTISKSHKEIRLRNSRPFKSVVSPNGKYLAVIDRYEDSHNSSIEVVDIEKNLTIFSEEYPIQALDISFSGNGNRLSIAGTGEDIAHPEGVAYIWDLDRFGKDLLTEKHFSDPFIFHSKDPIRAIALNTNPSYFATAQSLNVIVWQIKDNGEPMAICYVPRDRYTDKITFDKVGKNINIFTRINDEDYRSYRQETWYPFAYRGNNKAILPSQTIHLSFSGKNQLFRLGDDPPSNEDNDESLSHSYYSDFKGYGRAIYFSNDLKNIITEANDSIFIWNYSSLKKGFPLEPRFKHASSAFITDDMTWLALIDYDRKNVIVIQNEKNHYTTKAIFSFPDKIVGMYLEQDNRVLRLLNEKGKMIICDIVKKTTTPASYFNNLKSVETPHFSPGGNYVWGAVLNNNKDESKQIDIEVWNVQEQQKVAVIRNLHKYDNSFWNREYSWSADEEYLLVAANDSAVNLIDLKDTSFHQKQVIGAAIEKTSVSPSGRFYAVGTEGMVKIFNTSTAYLSSELPITKNISEITFNRDDSYVSIASNEETMVGIIPSLYVFPISPKLLIAEAEKRLKNMEFNKH